MESLQSCVSLHAEIQGTRKQKGQTGRELGLELLPTAGRADPVPTVEQRRQCHPESRGSQRPVLSQPVRKGHATTRVPHHNSSTGQVSRSPWAVPLGLFPFS